MHKKKLILFLVMIVVAAIGMGIFQSLHTQKKVQTETTNKVSHGKILKHLSLKSDVVEVDSKGDIAKIDVITPNLDTCSMKIIMYDLKNRSVLSETALDEGAWVTGMIDQGFYVANVTEKRLNIYDINGNLLREKVFETDDPWSYGCCVSDDGAYFIHTELNRTKAHVYHLVSGEREDLDLQIMPKEILSFSKDQVTYTSVQGEIYTLDMKTKKVRTISEDKRMSQHSQVCSVGMTEYNFIVQTQEYVEYIPFTNVDECILGVGEYNFSTGISNVEGDLLRYYDLIEKTVTPLQFDESIIQVHHSEVGKILVVCGDPMEQNYHIYECVLKDYKHMPLTINSNDEPLPEESPASEGDTKVTKEAKLIHNITPVHQYPDYPTGCESIATIMALKYVGETLTANEFINTYLPKSSNFYMQDQKKYGPSPYEYFVGNPRIAASYGCMAPVIEKAVIEYFGSTRRVVNTTDSSLETLCKTYIDADLPVILWATMDMVPINPVNSWYLENGEQFTWPGNEHCLLLVGYDSESYYFNDPLSGQLVKYDHKLVEERYEEMGRQSLVITK